MGSAHGPFYAASLTFPRNLSLPSTRPFYSARKQLGSLPGHAVTAKLWCTPSEACASPQGADRTTRERPGGTVPPETPSSQQPAWEKRWGPCMFQQREALSEQLAALAGPSWTLGGHPLGSRTYLWPIAFLCWLMWHHPAPCWGLRDALTVALTARPCPVWPGDAGISTHRLQQEICFLWCAVRPAAERVSECPCWEGGGRCGGAVYTLCPSLEHAADSEVPTEAAAQRVGEHGTARGGFPHGLAEAARCCCPAAARGSRGGWSLCECSQGFALQYLDAKAIQCRKS